MSGKARRAPGNALVFMTTIALTLAGCSTLEAGSTGAVAGSPSALPTAVTHIHGVDVDDERNRVTVATHYGLISVDVSADADPLAPPSVLGDYRGDVMAFVRAGDRLLLSGHPPAGSSDPANVGVIDADLDARNWSPLALSGDVDFHAMSRLSSGESTLIAGLDSVSGAVLTSDDDGVTWQRGASIAARDIAVGVDAASLFVTTELGLQRSIDQGLTWNPVGDAPLLVLIESGFDLAGQPVVVGVDVEGGWHVSSDGATWLSRGALPFVPEAVGVGDSGTLVIVSTQQAMRSRDGGASWTQIANMALELRPPG
jgi:hypothetical protein